MSFTNQTTHYGLPQWIGSDKPTYLVDQNNAYQTIDSELYNANTASGEAVTTAQGAVTTAEGAASTAATALSTAQGAETTANTADGKADNAITLAQSAQTAAGAAQTAAEAAQTAAAGNSITNLANAYDPTLTYNVLQNIRSVRRNSYGQCRSPFQGIYPSKFPCSIPEPC